MSLKNEAILIDACGMINAVLEKCLPFVARGISDQFEGLFEVFV